jgi:hypothetical protein
MAKIKVIQVRAYGSRAVKDWHRVLTEGLNKSCDEP